MLERSNMPAHPPSLRQDVRVGPRPTIIDIASRAGVSKSLVSLALRGDTRVGDSARERILTAARDLGYRSNALARALKEGRTLLLGVVIASLENPYHIEVVRGLEARAAEAGLTPILVTDSPDLAGRDDRLSTLLELNVDGVVVIGSRFDPDVLRSAAREAPLVMIGRSETTIDRIDSVNNDDEHGARLAVEHLAGLGRRAVLHVTSGSGPAGSFRRRGYEHTMRTLGAADRIRVLDRRAEPDLTAALHDAVAAGWDGVFARNDVEAFDVLDAARDAGLAMPGDLAVVGYDDTALAQRARPRLTSVNQPRARMGALAVELLQERIEGRTEDRHEVLTPTLTVRESTVP